MKEVLLYNLNNEKGKRIREVCASLSVSCCDITPADYLETIGALAGIVGYPRRHTPAGPAFGEEMMIFCDFNSDDIYNFLSRSKAAGIAPVHLKAALTPHNVQWNSLQIREELLKEHAAMNGGSAK